VKKKIKCIYIDGMEKTGKTSVIREMRKFLKNKNKDLHEIDGISNEKLDHQNIILSDNPNSIVLKENGLLQLYYDKLAQRVPVTELGNRYSEFIRKEQSMDHDHGVVHFFLIPSDTYTANEIYFNLEEEMPNYYHNLRDFFQKINSTSLAHGLNIELITFDEFDRVFDVRDKILKIIEKKYEI
jgi:hypothetical protein